MALFKGKTAKRMTTIDGIPVYRVLVDDERDGMVRVSLVDDPAVQSDFQHFDRQQRPRLFAVQDEEKRLVRGVVARADFPIYRNDAQLGEHYVIFPADTIRDMAQKYLTEGRADRVDTMHDGDEEDGIHLVQWFIKDTAAGVNPAGFEDIADGSLFAEYHVTNDDVWEAVKAGTFKGFSMEAFYTLRPEDDAAYVEEAVEDADGMFERIVKALTLRRNMNKKNLLRKLGRILASFATVTTDKGILAWDGDEDLKAGDRVYIEDADGERTEAADGDYTTEDGKVIVVADGAVAEIRDPEAEVAPAADEDPAPQENAALSRHNRIRELFEDSYEERYNKIYEALRALGLDWPYIAEAGDTYAIVCVWDVDREVYWRYDIAFDENGDVTIGERTEVKPAFVPVDDPEPAADPAPAADPDPVDDELAALRAENAALKDQVDKLSRTPLANPAHVEVNDPAAISKTGNKRLDNLARIAATIKK